MTDVTKQDHAAAGYLPIYGDTTGRDLYIGPDAGPGVLYDLITDRLGHIDAMLWQTCGAAGETFRDMNDTLQDNFLAAISQKVEEVQVMTREMYERG